MQLERHRREVGEVGSAGCSVWKRHDLAHKNQINGLLSASTVAGPLRASCLPYSDNLAGGACANTATSVIAWRGSLIVLITRRLHRVGRVYKRRPDGLACSL
jgi:hypothetical protein